MLLFEFQGQMARLVETFGARAFPKERTELIWKQVMDMDLDWLKGLCDRMIGDMRNPPMVSDFREAAYRQRQSKFNHEAEEAAKVWDTGEFNGLQKYLDSIGAKSLVDAVNKERLLIRNEEEK